MVEELNKSQVINGIRYKYSSSWIHSLETELHWRLYWRQQKLMQDFLKPGQSVLEIGVGSGFTANYPRSKGITVTTIDIDVDKQPDIIANIVSYDFAESYDHLLAFQVFEHIPFEEFKNILKRISISGFLFLSVPRNEKPWFRAEINMPKIGQRIIEINTLKKKITTETHFWEIDDGMITAAYFQKTLGLAGYRIERKDKAFSRLFYACRRIQGQAG